MLPGSIGGGLVRIVQISDTHLSQDKPHFLRNWAPLAAWIADQHPDLVIHTGDVTADGAGVEADLGFSAHLMDELGIRWRAVPGNHDVGDARHNRQPVNAERLSAWQRHFGPDRWVEDVAEGAQRWRLVGFDALLMGSGEPEEDEQAQWLEQVMAEAGERRIGWFLHRPLFLEDPGEGDTGYWSIKPQPRGVLLALVRRHRVALVASGHLHKARDFAFEGTRYIWSPASSFLVGAPQPEMPGEKRLGAVVYELDNGTLTARIAEVPDLTQHWWPSVAAPLELANPALRQ
ncbi:MAG: metallophosphoesterase [Stellaceae bacterium]